MTLNLTPDLSGFDFINLLDLIGTFAFAISGIRLSAEKNFDIFGAYVVGLVTAIGGGTIRDLLLGLTPFWMQNGSYLIITGVALLSFLLFRNIILKMDKTLFLFDNIGLGLFVVVGIDKSLVANFPIWVAIIMGTITGSVGGLLRDILINEVPLILRRDIYALACVFGGMVYATGMYFSVTPKLLGIITLLSVVLIRFLTFHYKFELPTLKQQLKPKK